MPRHASEAGRDSSLGGRRLSRFETHCGARNRFLATSRAPQPLSTRFQGGEMQYLRERLMLLLLAATLLTAVAIPPQSAAAQQATSPVSQQIPCTIAGLPNTCTLTVTGFQIVNGALNAVGTITGGGVSIPFQVPTTVTESTCD